VTTLSTISLRINWQDSVQLKRVLVLSGGLRDRPGLGPLSLVKRTNPYSEYN